MEYFRMLTTDDIDAYYKVLHRGYQSDRQYDISFTAMNATKEEERVWLMQNPTYAWFIDDCMVSAITLRMPWGPKPGPRVFPHIGQFVTDPDFKHCGYATKLLRAVEQNIIIKELKSPAVTLGTAEEHPWLKEMYEKMGFTCFGNIQLKNKKHKTVYFQKNLI